MSNLIKITNLKYNKIIDNISITFKNNKIYSILGENGSGKTTLLKCIGGLIEYDGQITCDSNIQLCLDDSIFLYDKVIKNIEFSLKCAGYEENTLNQYLLEIIDEFNISNIIDKKIANLSISEIKFLKILQSIIVKPDILIIDNVFSGMNKNYFKFIVDKLKSLKNTMIIFTTTDSEEALISDEVIIMKTGKIICQDKSQKLLKNDSLLLKNNLNVPFFVELSSKLKSYDLVDEIVLNLEDLIGEL